MNLREKIEWLRGWAPTQDNITLCSRILDVCDAADKWDKQPAPHPDRQEMDHTIE